MNWLKKTSPRVLVWLAPFLLLAPVWLTGRALYWGTPSTQFMPWWWQAWQTLLSGEWPLWNPLLGMGAPLVANYQSAIFYPPNWTYFLLAAIGGLPLMAWGQAILLAAHLALAGWGMLRLLQKLKAPELGQVLGALAFSLSGYLVARAHFLSINAAVAWLPWILLATYELAAPRAGWRAALKLSAFFALQCLAGHAQVAGYSLLLAGAWLLFWASRPANRAGWRRALGRFALAGLAALALSAVQLLPTAEYLLQSQRAAQVDPTLAMTYSFWPWRFLTLLAPNLFGSPAQGNFAGFGNYWEDAVYIGLLPLLLAGLAVLRAEKATRPFVNFFLGTTIVSFILALGRHTPVFPWLFTHVPGFDMFQGPARFSLWAVLSLSMLAALGAAAWRPPRRHGLYWSRLAVAGAAAVLLGTLAAAGLRAAGHFTFPDSYVTATLLLGFTALGLALINLHAWRLDASVRNWLVCAFVALDLLVAGWGLNPATPLDLYAPEPLHAELQEELDGGRLYISREDERTLKFGRWFRFDTFFGTPPVALRAGLLPNIGLLEGIPSANNFDPLLPRRYVEWIDALESADADTRAKMLALMSVAALQQIGPGGEGVRFESIQSLPRVRWLPCAVAVNDMQAALAELTGVDISNLVLVETEHALPACSPPEAGQAQIAHSTANTVQVDVHAPGGGWLLLADTWYPGWRAYADGAELSIYPAYGVFRAVELPAGVASVEFVYRPLSFSVGLTASLLAWPAWLLLWRRSRR